MSPRKGPVHIDIPKDYIMINGKENSFTWRSPKYNKNIDFSISPYYDRRNKWGVGGFKISLNL